MMNRFMSFMRLLSLGGALAVLLTGCGKSQAELKGEVAAAMTANIEKEFQSFQFEKASQWNDGLTPTLIYQGKTSNILATSKPQLTGGIFWSSTVYVEGLALTKNGRYFSFTYFSALKLDASVDNELHFFDSPCLAAKCRGFHEGYALSRQQAKEWLFQREIFTPELFEKIFKEPAPPKHIDA